MRHYIKVLLLYVSGFQIYEQVEKCKMPRDTLLNWKAQNACLHDPFPTFKSRIVKRSQGMRQVLLQNGEQCKTLDLILSGIYTKESRRKENMVALGCLKLANLVTAVRTDASRRHFWRLQFNTALPSCRHPCSYRYCDSWYRWTLATQHSELPVII